MIQKVVAYCRVSTDKDDQLNSLESQKKYFAEYITRNPQWELVEVYADEGVTGTSTKKRHSFNKMMNDARNGKFNLIITKEVSRFARNTVDTLQHTRELKALGVGVVFTLDNINTLDNDGELRLTMMASIAQEESRKTSERVKWGHKRQMENGVVFGLSMLGYDVKDGKMSINEEGAEVVRLIYHKFLNEDKGTHVIARELREAGVKTYNGHTNWSNISILRALRNEKYCGDLFQKKTFTPSYLDQNKKYNRGEEEMVKLYNHHEPIISRETFEQAQAELLRRSPSEEQKAKHSNRYAFSGKIQCGECGASFVSRTKTRKDKSQYKAWRCHEGAKNGSPKVDEVGNEIGCSCPSLNNSDAQAILQTIVRQLSIDKNSIVNRLTGAIKDVFQTADSGEEKRLTNELAKLHSKIQELVEMYLDKKITQTEYQSLSAKFQQQIAELETRLKEIGKQAELQENHDKVIADITMTIKNLADGTQWNDILYRKLLEKIIVHEGNKIDIYLNLLPNAWSFKPFISKPKKGSKHRRKSPLCNKDTPLPISVNNPLSSG